MLATGLDGFILIYLIGVVFLAAIVRGYAGFGTSALFIASCSMILPVSELVPLALMMEVIASAYMLPSVWRQVDWNMFRWIGLGSIVVIPFGVYILATMPVTPARVVVYTMIAGICFLIWRGYSLKTRGNYIWFATGLVSGSMSGVAGLGGLGMMLMFLSSNADPIRSRATMIALILVVNVYTAALNYHHGLIDTQTASRLLILIPPLILGVALGQRRFHKARPGSFRNMALLLLFGLSVVGLVKTLWL